MNPEAIEAATEYLRSTRWMISEAEASSVAQAALEAAAPYLIRELALKQMVSMPWFEELVMAEALAYHSGGNCRFETEARATELEAAAHMFHYTSGVTNTLRERAAAIRAGETE